MRNFVFVICYEECCLLFPSRVLYEKYPLDAYSAWMEWKEARKPKRWRAQEKGEYWCIVFDGNAISTIELDCRGDHNLYNFGNYFRTKGEAIRAAEVVREALAKFHEQNAGK